jgi:molybdopterin-containing oxidoreductase family iron-sulfur binding subunit
VAAPVWVLPGQTNGVVTLSLGYGRRRGGRVASGIGFDAYALRSSSDPWHLANVTMEKTSATHLFASTQNHALIRQDGQDYDHPSVEAFRRDLVQIATLRDYQTNPHFAQPDGQHGELSLFPAFKYGGYAWAMSIDLGRCIGCSACMIACQAENNIPIVGKAEVARGREMHWIRVDTYYRGELDDPRFAHQPVPCMHCELAPCEPVCPVAATVHDADGLNSMIYNRCVGTRYCSNNCPYKVRRFNFKRYTDPDTLSLAAMRNPDVTVRGRGVMEKCTYCVQRISAAKILAEKESRRVRDGEIVPACAAACPAEAIVFGDINDGGSRVAKLKAQPRDYALLHELNTRPRTTYLARIENPNPELQGKG